MPGKLHLGSNGAQATPCEAQRPYAGDRRMLVRLRLQGALRAYHVAERDYAPEISAPRALVGLHHGHALPDAVALGLGHGGQDGEA